jgi:IclR family acetate operon transcriptional repressor
MAPSAEVDQRVVVQSLARALAILQTLSESHGGLTLTRLSETVALPPSTAHRLLTTLQRQRFVRFEAASMLWQIGVQAFVVGNAFARMRDVVAIARPYMRRLMEESGETVNLYLLSEDEAVCMAQVESRQTMRAISRPGGQVRLHMSGAGKALLASLPDDEVDRIAASKGLPRATERTLVTLAALKAELGKIRALGFAVDDEEYAVGLRCVAASILDERGIPLAALSLSGPSVRVSDERLGRLGAQVIEASRAASLDLGGRGSAA